jgi:thioesterase domain-containing protein/acyl carrier protein
VANAAVVLRTDAGSEPRLVAYYVPAESATHSPAEVRAALARTLPPHMVPSAIMPMETLPITPTGKIDRRALPAPEAAAPSEDAVAPRDDVEARVLRIWEQVLGTRNIGVTDPFNEVGGHSLAAVKVFSRIEKEFGAKIQLAAMLRHDTVEKMATLLREPAGSAAAKADEWSCIVPFETTGTGAPVFCAHPMSGNVLFYQYFAKEIGGRHPVYGIQALGNWGTQEPQETVEEMVEYYAEEIRKVRPHGPYIFFGVSFGGLLAVELARHMRERGEEVQLVVLYDTAGPDYPKYNSYGRVVKFVREHGGISLQRLRHILMVDPPGPKDRPMRFRTPRIVLWNLRQTAKWWFSNTRRDFLYWRFEHHNAPHDYPLPANLTRFRLATRRILRRYRAAFYPGKLTIFRAADQPAGIVEEGTNGWGPVCAEVEVHTFPGGHLTGMRPPDVRNTARVFLECLEREVARERTALGELVSPNRGELVS